MEGATVSVSASWLIAATAPLRHCCHHPGHAYAPLPRRGGVVDGNTLALEEALLLEDLVGGAAVSAYDSDEGDIAHRRRVSGGPTIHGT